MKRIPIDTIWEWVTIRGIRRRLPNFSAMRDKFRKKTKQIDSTNICPRCNTELINMGYYLNCSYCNWSNLTF